MGISCDSADMVSQTSMIFNIFKVIFLDFINKL